MAVISQIQGVGLGLKRELIPQIQASYGQKELANINFVEIAPENWINVGGKSARQLEWIAERYPIVCHGLCLSLGGLSPLNVGFLQQVKTFLHQYQIAIALSRQHFIQQLQVYRLVIYNQNTGVFLLI